MIGARDASRIATTVLVMAVLSLLLLHALFARETGWIVVQVIAALLMLWSRLSFGMRSWHGAADPTEGGLAMKGPYRFLRHPIYSAILLFIWVGVASNPSVYSIAAVVIASAATAVRIATEEKLVAERYLEYAAYAARTKRLIPFVF